MAKSLSSLEKVAVFLVGVGEELAAEFFRHFSQAEVQRISIAMDRLGEVSQETLDEVFSEFYQLLKQPAQQTTPSGFMERALLGTVKTDMDGLIRSFSGPERLAVPGQIDAETLFQVIREDSPQTIAIILSHTDSKKSAKVIKMLDQSERSEILLRMARIGPVASSTLEVIDDHLREKVASFGVLSMKKRGGTKKVAAILNHLESPLASNILANMTEKELVLGKKVRSEMFVFEDLLRIEPGSMVTVITSVPWQNWVLALRDASPQLKALIFSCLSSRKANELRDALDRGPSVRVAEVHQAQAFIVAKVLELSAQTRIVINR